MTPPITIRPGRPEDADTILALGVKTFRDTFGAHNSEADMKLYLDKAFAPGRIRSEFDEPGSLFFIAEDGNVPVGYARVRTPHEKHDGLDGTSLEIERIYSVQEYLGKRVGQSLMNACVDHACERGCDAIWLGVWEHNARAIAFYEKNGFERFGQHDFMLGNDRQTDLLLKKKLT